MLGILPITASYLYFSSDWFQTLICWVNKQAQVFQKHFSEKYDFNITLTTSIKQFMACPNHNSSNLLNEKSVEMIVVAIK